MFDIVDVVSFLINIVLLISLRLSLSFLYKITNQKKTINRYLRCY